MGGKQGQAAAQGEEEDSGLFQGHRSCPQV